MNHFKMEFIPKEEEKNKIRKVGKSYFEAFQPIIFVIHRSNSLLV